MLIAHSFYRISGGEDACVRQQLDLLQPHHDVSLFDKHNRDLEDGLSSALRMLYSWRIQQEAERVIRTFRPDVVHIHNAYPALGPAIFLAAGKLRRPVVVTIHNYRLRCPNGYMFTADSICTRCERGAYHNAVLHPCFATRKQGIAYASNLWVHRFVLDLEEKVRLFICPSEFMLATLQRWGLPPHRLRLVRNFVYPAPDPDTTPGKCGMYVGRLSREKGVHILLHALKRAGDPPFMIVGDGPEADRLRRLASQLELVRARFLGRVPPEDVDGFLREARFVVLPSVWNENAPLVALEAMARGRALIVSSVGGLQELAQDGRGGRRERR